MNVLYQAYLLGSAINILPWLDELEDAKIAGYDGRCCAGCCAPCRVLLALKDSGELDKIFLEAYVDGEHWASGFGWWKDEQVDLEYLHTRIKPNCELCKCMIN